MNYIGDGPRSKTYEVGAAIYPELHVESMPAVTSSEEVDGLWSAEGEIDDGPIAESDTLLSTGSPGVLGIVCPNPTRWKFVDASGRTSNLQRISAIVSAQAVPITATLTVQRSLTFTAGVTAGVKAGIKLIEIESGVMLQTSVTVRTGTSYRITVPKGRRVALFGGSTFIVRVFERTVYTSAGPCYPLVQRTTVTSPVSPIVQSQFV